MGHQFEAETELALNIEEWMGSISKASNLNALCSPTPSVRFTETKRRRQEMETNLGGPTLHTVNSCPPIQRGDNI